MSSSPQPVVPGNSDPDPLTWWDSASSATEQQSRSSSHLSSINFTSLILTNKSIFPRTMSQPSPTIQTRGKSIHSTTYPMVPQKGAEPDPKPNFARMFLHVGAAGVMVAGFNALSSMAVGKVVTPQVCLTSWVTCCRADVVVWR